MTGLAISTLERSAAAQPRNPTYLYHLGLAYAQDGQHAAARRSLERALELSPNFEGASDARALLSSLKG
jgi:Flp pilus assembly protein TadD